MREVIEHQVCHLARLVDDLLDVSRFTRGKIQLRKEPLDLATVIRQAIEAARPVLESHGHTLSVDIVGALMWLEADPTRLRQIVSNLLDNAAKYTDPGGTVLLTAVSQGEEVVVKVRDTGVGISADMLPRIFDRSRKRTLRWIGRAAAWALA